MPKTVLIVEDDVLLRMNATLMFQGCGFKVVEADNADDALSILKQQHDQVIAVLTDVHLLGDMDGFALAWVVAANWPTIEIVVTSGTLARPGDLPAGARFLPKPWRRNDVLAALAA